MSKKEGAALLAQDGYRLRKSFKCWLTVSVLPYKYYTRSPFPCQRIGGIFLISTTEEVPPRETRRNRPACGRAAALCFLFSLACIRENFLYMDKNIHKYYNIHKYNT